MKVRSPSEQVALSHCTTQVTVQSQGQGMRMIGRKSQVWDLPGGSSCLVNLHAQIHCTVTGLRHENVRFRLTSLGYT